MQAEFWLERWQTQKTGFHLEAINPGLQQYWSDTGLSAGQRVFVPLCGKTLDLWWLLEQGYQVCGVELSPLAVAALFEQHSVTPEVAEHGNLQCWRYHELAIWCGDIFDLSPEQVGQVDAVYDRAALVALPEQMRAAYARQLVHLTRTAPQLLITLEYDQSQMAGPPFSVTQAEIARLYGADYSGCDPMQRQDVLEQEAKFQERGLQHLLESIYLLIPRQNASV